MPAASTSSPSSTRPTACSAPPSSRCAATAPCSACSTTGPSCRVPLATVQITVQHEREFTANGVELIGTQDVAEPYLVLTPTTIELSHDSEFYHADPEKVLVDRTGRHRRRRRRPPGDRRLRRRGAAPGRGIPHRRARRRRVLLPAGCPFGETIVNRIVTEPVWSMTDVPGRHPRFPTVASRRGECRRRPRPPISWSMCNRCSTDRSRPSTQDVPFAVQYEVIVQQNGDPLVTPIAVG